MSTSLLLAPYTAFTPCAFAITCKSSSVSPIDDNDDSYINRLRIKEGRLPQNDKECVVKYESTREAVKVGDVLKFKSGTSDDINDTFKDTEYTVVGVVYSPCFVSYDLGSSDIGNGNISYCVYYVPRIIYNIRKQL